MHAIRRQAHRAACRNEDGSSSNFNPFARRRARETPSKTENDSRDLSEATVATSNTEDNTGVERDQEVGAPLQAKQEDMPQGNVVNMGPDNTEQTVTTKSLDSYPKGYPNLVAFQSSEPSFSIYRSFSYLHSRVLLHMQDELVELEKELASLDKEAGAFAGPGHIGVNSASRRGVLEQTNDTYQASRRRLLEQMKDKLVDYDENLRQARELALMSERRSAAQNDTFTRWFRSGRSKLLPREDQQHGVPNRAIRTFQQFSSYGIPLYIHNLGRRSSLMAQR
ncbi:hypothetical protein BDV96DRAFT_303752 [Lophiotrema nucula]|uniref:DUF6594 domain-containing protein n=1 Tax=Lophiotrema nucula TaxID=690887 RepID=A0A6A5YJC6_9PLEO|nr:hypothetical protein BDV96DRAFT_303752 [Lophiotrema nucula]